MTPKRIIIVDDEEDFVKILVRNLALYGYDATGCTTSRQALNRIKKGPYDLAIIDYKIPKMAGDILIEKIQNLCSRCEFIIVTGYSVEGRVREIMDTNSKVNACLPKPLDIRDLVNEIEKIHQT